MWLLREIILFLTFLLSSQCNSVEILSIWLAGWVSISNSVGNVIDKVGEFCRREGVAHLNDASS